MRVLLIEDTPRLAEAVAEILRKSGYGADVAHIGADGLAMALTGAYDVLLLDIMLPDMSGMDVLRKLREAGSVVPVILLTARQGVGDRVAGLDAGADDYLPKPFHARTARPHSRGHAPPGNLPAEQCDRGVRTCA